MSRGHVGNVTLSTDKAYRSTAEQRSATGSDKSEKWIFVRKRPLFFAYTIGALKISRNGYRVSQAAISEVQSIEQGFDWDMLTKPAAPRV
jgi:hypothetical protein